MNHISIRRQRKEIEKKKERENDHKQMKKKIANLSPNIPIISLNINCLNTH